MDTKELKRRAKRRIDSLSPERAQTADDFLAYLEDREDNDATAELMRIPGLLDELRKAEQEVTRGETVVVEDLKRKY
jgi:hypothetical protein